LRSLRWYVTGTPFPNHYFSLRQAVRFLDLHRVDAFGSYEGESLSLVRLLEASLEDLYWRSSKQSVGDEVSLPEINEEVSWHTVVCLLDSF
jgi:hypothetical protein